MTDREIFKMALNCLLAWEKESSGHGWSIADQECVEALRSKLAYMKPVTMHPNLPEATTALGTVVKPKQWVECTHCKQLSPLEERKWVGLTGEDIKDIEGWVEFKEAGSNERVPLGKLALYISHKIREKNE